MKKTLADMADMAQEAARAQQYFLRSREIAGEWLDGAKGEPIAIVLLAATLVQAVAGKEINSHNGMTPSEIMLALGSDMAMLADLLDDNAS